MFTGECFICTGPAARDGLCRTCLRMRAFSKNQPLGCVCPVGAAAECGHARCPRRPILLAGVSRIAEVQRIVSEAYDIPLTAMKGKGRSRIIARPRQVAMYLSAELTGASLNTIGAAFGKRDHTTVMHAKRATRDHMDGDIAFAGIVEALRLRIVGGDNQHAKN